MNELFDLTGKVAIVTGGSRGIGNAIAVGLAKAGANVAVSDIRDTQETVAEITRLGKEGLGMPVDVSKKQDVQAMVDRTIERFGRIDILVNNAGVFDEPPVEKVEEKDWDKMMAVNLKSQFFCSQAAGRHMKKQGDGKIINLASIAGQVFFPGGSLYGISKAGVIMLTKALAAEWGKYHINVNAICPAFLKSVLTMDWLAGMEDPDEFFKAKVPLGRPAELEEIVGTVIYLASKASDYVTGQIIGVDGGTVVKW